MRRAGRHKLIHISILIFVWSIIHVLSAKNPNSGQDEPVPILQKQHATNTEVGNKKTDLESEGGKKSTTSITTTTSTSSSTATSTTTTTPRTPTSTTTNPTTTISTRKTTVNTPTSTKEVPTTEFPRTTSTPSNTTNATTPNKKHCIPAAIGQFPRPPLIGPWGRKHGGLIIHFIVAIYTFLGLAIVCDEYFVAALDRICEELKMSPDVAGATFMAAGSSAPELATVIIGVFFAEDDIGVSGVIGSAVFNIMFVISVCALCSTTVIYLDWWPLVRDCFFYAVSILVMLFTIYNGTISWGESLFMILVYVVYCVVLHFNPQLEQWAHSLPVPCKPHAPEEQSGLMTYKTLDEEGKHPNYGLTPDGQENVEQGFDGAALNRVSNAAAGATTASGATTKTQNYYVPKEYDPSKQVNPLLKPVDGTIYQKYKWAILYPIHYLCIKTIPDCRTERFKNWYAFTFFMAMLWISFYSYFMVWMITIIGSTLNIPDTVMGLTFVAAGVSVPDALSSVAVIKEGYGDMAVSNAVGSNVFDILVCLGLPWFLDTAILHPGAEVKVISKGLTYSTVSLLSTVVFLLVATHLNGWKLDRRYGVILMIWYLIFITLASLYELNVFGDLNPPVCATDY